MMRRWMLILCLASTALVAAVNARAAEPVLKAGAAAVKITPSLERTVYIAGYDNNRVAESVHDDLWARALVLELGNVRLAVVSCDLIGLSNYRVRQIRKAIHSVPGDNVLIACTHVHSGPDTLGLWGKDFAHTGLDAEYLATLRDRVVEAVDTAAKRVRPVELEVGTVTVPEGLVYNSREAIQDKKLTALRFIDTGGKTVASIIHYGGHPEVNKSRAITSDFVHYARQEVEREFGGTAIYLQGALGGMVTPKVSGHTFEEMQRVGEGVGQAAVDALRHARREEVERLAIVQNTLYLPLENLRFKMMAQAKILDADAAQVPTNQTQTEVWRVDLGPVTWVTIPGEVLPRPELQLKSKIPGPYPMVVAMGNDELGYILDPEDYPKDLYKYERSMSIGPNTWPKLLEAAETVLKQNR